MEIRKHSSLVRWFVLVVVSLHVLYVNVYDLIVKQNTIPQITEKYKSLFVPAPFTFSIWIVLYILFFVYAIYQLLPSQKGKELFDDIALPFMISITLGIWWGITYHFELIGLSMIPIIGMLVFAFSVYREIYHAYLYDECPKWYLYPFSIYFGWLIVASLANLTIWLVSIGSNNILFSEMLMGRILALLIFIIGISLSVKYWDFVLPLAIAWGLVGVYIGQKDSAPPVAGAAIFFAIILIVWSTIVTFIKKTPRLENLPR